MVHKYFTETDSVTWISEIQRIVDAYNNNPHRGLKNIKPNDVENRKEEVLKMNIDKANEDLNIDVKIFPGDKVRVRIKGNVFSKGYIQQWSDEIYTVVKVMKASATLDNGSKEKLSDLQKVSDNTDNSKQNTTFQSVTQQNKEIKEFNKEGLNKEDIIPERMETRQTNNKRERKQVKKYQA
jgi:hypothetical protein